MKKEIMALGAFAMVGNAFGVLIDFDTLADNDILGNQYAGQGVTFSAGHTSADVTENAGWSFATNTLLEAATLAEGDVGSGLGGNFSGTIINSFSAWLSANGSPTMTIDFATAVSSVSLEFGGIDISSAGASGLWAINSADAVVSTAFVSGNNSTEVVSLSGLNVNRVVVTMGSFGDWVGVDNLNYEPVPEPATMTVLALAALAAARRRKQK